MPTQSPFEYFSSHIHLIGWPVLLYYGITLSIKATRLFTKLEANADHAIGNLATVKEQADKMAGQVDVLASNHFPHIQESLQSIDGNIRLLVDRTTRL